MKQWFAVHTRAQMEETANLNLLMQGFEVFYPRIVKKCRIGTKMVDKERPAYPRYLFVESQIELLGPAYHTIGVSTVLRNADGPTRIPGIVIARILSLFDDRGVALPPPPMPDPKVGDRVRIIAGSFEGQLAEIERVDKNRKIRVAIRTIRGILPATVGLDHVEAAA